MKERVLKQVVLFVRTTIYIQFHYQKRIYQKPKLSNCLRAYINQDDQEVCTFSDINDFTVAPEILNCKTYIHNCLQRLLFS
ncbi:unnamed protein product [Paramecium octaurelia]|uniref:Uncharacterized protein n=1 Tax=Paramecium octaurelia TaxID=43137 RepID=A0A8S1W9W1_PAROT|nr:unnamed protein product [Paramecium octaurelia]